MINSSAVIKYTIILSKPMDLRSFATSNEYRMASLTYVSFRMISSYRSSKSYSVQSFCRKKPKQTNVRLYRHYAAGIPLEVRHTSGPAKRWIQGVFCPHKRTTTEILVIPQQVNNNFQDSYMLFNPDSTMALEMEEVDARYLCNCAVFDGNTWNRLESPLSCISLFTCNTTSCMAST